MEKGGSISKSISVTVLQVKTDKRDVVKISTDATVSELLIRISEATNLPSRTIRLFCAGQELTPVHALLKSFNLTDGLVIHMTTKVVELDDSAKMTSGNIKPLPVNQMNRASSSATMIDLTEPSNIPTTSRHVSSSSSDSAINYADLSSWHSLLQDDLSFLLPGAALCQGERPLPCRMTCPPKVLIRLGRLDSQRLRLVETLDLGSALNLSRKYIIVGSQDVTFEVNISRMPSCTCADANGEGAILPCKHIMFVLVKVLKLSRGSPLIYQESFLQEELGEMFDVAGRTTHVTADEATSSQAVRSAPTTSVFSRLKSNSIVILSDEVPSSSASSTSDMVIAAASKSEIVVAAASPPPLECPICFEELKLNGEGDGEATCSCSVCTGIVHVDCIKHWISRSKTCPCCRSPWKQLSKDKGRGTIKRSRTGGMAVNAVPANTRRRR